MLILNAMFRFTMRRVYTTLPTCGVSRVWCWRGWGTPRTRSGSWRWRSTSLVRTVKASVARRGWWSETRRWPIRRCHVIRLDQWEASILRSWPMRSQGSHWAMGTGVWSSDSRTGESSGRDKSCEMWSIVMQYSGLWFYFSLCRNGWLWFWYFVLDNLLL